MEATEPPSYICLVKSTDFSRYSKDELNKINSEYMKDHKKLKGIVKFSTYNFGIYIHNIRSKKWKEAEENRKGAQDDCEKLLQLLDINGLRSDHQQKQSSSLVLNKHKNGHINAKKPTTGESREYFSKAQQIPGIAYTTKSSGKTEMAPDSENKVDKTTSSKSVQHSNTHQEITQGHVYHKNSGVLDATGSVTDESEIMRRSKDAGMRLKHDKPNIFDLSDPNRPSKLTERFSELYSNEYTDALEELNGTNSYPVESIQCLLDIVKAAYLFCTKRRKQMNDEQIKLTGSSTDDHVRRYEMELRKTAEEVLPNVRQEFMKPRIKVMQERTQWFAEQCVEIVWLMCIQQLPMHLEWVENKREKFNPDLYQDYTKSGKFIKFCVWPIVRLHENGPILTRGIAQGCD